MYPQYPVQTKQGMRSGQGLWMSFILATQTFLTFARLYCLFDVTNGFMMGIIVILGWYALRRSLDITLVSIWGLANAALLLTDIVEALTATGSYLIRLRWTTIALLLANPMSDFLAANYAWELFKDHERSGGMLQPLFATKDAKGKYQTDIEQAAPTGQARSAKYQPDYATQYGHAGQPDYYDTYSAGYGHEQELQGPADAFRAPGSRKQNAACC